MHPSDVFTNRIPYRPYCSNDLSTGLKVRSAKQALDCLHIQPNPPLQITWLVFDLDFEGAAFAWEKRNVAPPSIIAINPANAHAHLFYGLITPVTVSDAGRHAPIRYAAALQAAYAAALQADLGYACEFRPKLDSNSDGTWTLIPRQTGHRFRPNLDSPKS